MPHHILVADDDPHIREVICFALSKAGMRTEAVGDGASALQQAAADQARSCRARRRHAGDGRARGLPAIRRKTSDVPILFLSARDDEIDRVLGLEMGGDDYVTKPFSPRELVARVNVILRRAARPGAEGRDRRSAGATACCCLMPAPHRQLRRTAGGADGNRVRHAESLLMAARATCSSRDKIMHLAYAKNIHVSDRTIDSHIRNLRAKLAAAGCADAIETVHGVGFKVGRCGG
jgi:two-component system OmpR family response regulator